MAIKQLTVFVQNRKGTVVEVTKALSENNVNIRALSIAETGEFGILRLITNDDQTAEKTLKDAGYIIKAIDVVGVKSEMHQVSLLLHLKFLIQTE